jgi:ketosteroid isomerase-like protein
MSIEDGIRRTVARYCQLFNSKQWGALGTVFSDDAVIITRRGTFSGRDAVVEDLKGALPPSYNGTLFVTNTVITVEGDAATAVSEFLGVDGSQITATGTYVDKLVRSGDEWLLSSKEIRLK